MPLRARSSAAAAPPLPSFDANALQMRLQNVEKERDSYRMQVEELQKHIESQRHVLQTSGSSEHALTLEVVRLRKEIENVSRARDSLESDLRVAQGELTRWTDSLSKKCFTHFTTSDAE